jgi:hypothetical protein
VKDKRTSERREETAALRQTVKEQASRSYMRLPYLAGHTDGVPVLGFGRTYILGVSPDFEKDVVIQDGNAAERVKIKPRKSWEIGENRIGSFVSYQPRNPRNDVQSLLSLNLIDGNPDTFWCSRGQGQPDVESAWIRIDLAKEENLREIVLVPRKGIREMSKELTVKISKDAWHWKTVHESKEVALPGDDGPLRIPLGDPARAKQIWIIGNDFPLVSLAGAFHDAASEYGFALTGVEVVNDKGENVALVSRGAGVTVSSTNYASGSSWDVYDLFWPMQYDLGVKWLRLSAGNAPYHHDTLQWCFVEQEKGKYHIDEKTYRAITEAANNGCQIVLQLCYGNWLYSEPEKESIDPEDFPHEFPPPPLTREEIEGFKSFVRFMVEHFKGRVEYWEIWNEPDFFGYCDVLKDKATIIQAYCDLVKEVVPVIRETDPDAKISLAGISGVPGISGPWINQYLDEGVMELVDAIGWHSQCWIYPESPRYKDYPGAIREFQRAAEARGFKGLFMVTEHWLGAPYPPHKKWPHPPHVGVSALTKPLPPLTEVRKAKDTARTYLMNHGLGVITFWCDTWCDTVQCDIGLFRNTFSADPVSPSQPEVVYYAMRTLCTVMDGAEPADLDVALKGTIPPEHLVWGETTSDGHFKIVSEGTEMPREYEHYCFTMPEGGLMIGVYLTGQSVDTHPGIPTEVTINGIKCSRVVGIDILNGFEQELEFEQEGDKLVVRGVFVRDYPVMLRLYDVERCGPHENRVIGKQSREGGAK